MPDDVRLLKVDVPSDAMPQTAWQVTRVSRQPYYQPQPTERQSWEESGPLSYEQAATFEGEAEDSDVFVLRKKRLVSVTPISLDLTSRVALPELDRHLRE